MKQPLARKGLLIMLLLLQIFCGGCWSRREIDKLSFVGSVAIDVVDNSELLNVTAQLIRPETLGGETARSASAPGGKVWLVSVEGSTVFEALSKLNTVSPNRLFFGHLTSVIIGEDLARRGVVQLLDVFVRMPQLRRTVWIVVTPGKAKRILEASPKLQEVPSLTIENLFMQGKDSSVAFPSILNNFLIALSSRSTAPLAARVMTVSSKETEERDEKGKEIKLEGSAMFRRDKFVKWLDGRETRGVLWICNKVNHTTLTIQNPEENHTFLSFEVLSTKSKIHTVIKDQKLTVNIKISLDSDIVEQSGNEGMLSEELKLEKENVKAFESALALQVKEEACAALEKAQHFQSDVFGIGERFYIEHPQEFKQIQKDWPELFAKADFDVEVTVKIRRTGLINKNIKIQQ